MSQTVTVGRRKASIARVFMSPGTGNILVNKRELKEYFCLDHLVDSVVLPIKTAEVEGKYDFLINVKGGGYKGQAEAVRLGIARALVKDNEEVKPLLKAKDLMTRDSRVVERKKPGLRKARKKPQFSKR